MIESYAEGTLSINKYSIDMYLKTIGLETYFKKVAENIYDIIAKIVIKEFNLGHSWFHGNKELFNELHDYYSQYGIEATYSRVIELVNQGFLSKPQINSLDYPTEEEIVYWVDDALRFGKMYRRKIVEILKKYNCYTKEIKSKLYTAHREYEQSKTTRKFKNAPRKTIAEINIGLNVEDDLIIKYNKDMLDKVMYYENNPIPSKYAIVIGDKKGSHVEMYNDYAKMVYKRGIEDSYYRVWLTGQEYAFLTQRATFRGMHDKGKFIDLRQNPEALDFIHCIVDVRRMKNGK